MFGLPPEDTFSGCFQEIQNKIRTWGKKWHFSRIKENMLREHRQKLVRLSGFWLLKGCGCEGRDGGCLSKSVEKGKFVMKIFFQILLNEVLKVLEK